MRLPRAQRLLERGSLRTTQQGLAAVRLAREQSLLERSRRRQETGSSRLLARRQHLTAEAVRESGWLLHA